MNPGDRVILTSIKPLYLDGARATFVRAQPGEPRVLVRLDNTPDYRRFAGGEWCVHERQVVPDPSFEGIFGLINTDIDARARQAVPVWTEDIAQVLEAAVDSWAYKQGFDRTNIDPERWEELYRPALLWRFYTHLASELKKIGEGHEEVLFNALREGKG